MKYSKMTVESVKCKLYIHKAVETQNYKTLLLHITSGECVELPPVTQTDFILVTEEAIYVLRNV